MSTCTQAGALITLHLSLLTMIFSRIPLGNEANAFESLLVLVDGSINTRTQNGGGSWS